MRICPKKGTAVLNLVAIAAMVWLYCLDKIAADPVAAMPGQPSSMQAPVRIEQTDLPESDAADEGADR